jgi:hypothetical protein
MSTNEIMDTALKVYQRRGLTLLRLTALPSVFCLAACAYVVFYVLPSIGSTKDTNDIAVQATELITRLSLAIFVGGPIFLFGLTYATALVVKISSDDIEGRETNEHQAEKLARQLLPKLFWLNMRELLYSVSGLLVATGFLLLGGFLTIVTPEDTATAGLVAAVGMFGLAVGGIIFLFVISRDALVPAVAVIEGEGGKIAGKRSRQLLNVPKDKNPIVRTHGPGHAAVWNLYLLLGLIACALLGSIYGVAFIFDLPTHLSNALPAGWVKTLVMSAAGLLPIYFTIWVLIPVWATALTVIYYERRIRLEGFDIECIAQHIKIHDRASRFNV